MYKISMENYKLVILTTLVALVLILFCTFFSIFLISFQFYYLSEELSLKKKRRRLRKEVSLKKKELNARTLRLLGGTCRGACIIMFVKAFEHFIDELFNKTARR